MNTDRSEPSTITIALASLFLFGLLVLALPAMVSVFAAPARPPAPVSQTVPTAIILPTATPSPVPSPVPSLTEEPAPTEAPALDELPATLPAGVSPDDLSLTIYQGWRWRDTGNRAGDRCQLEVWADEGPPDQVWIVCILLGL